jgi:hypothetical protein
MSERPVDREFKSHQPHIFSKTPDTLVLPAPRIGYFDIPVIPGLLVMEKWGVFFPKVNVLWVSLRALAF